MRRSDFVLGMEAIVYFLRREGIICNTKDNCSECNKVDKYIKKRIKELNSQEMI